MKLDAVRRYRAQVEDVLRMDLLRARQDLQDAETLCHALDTQMRATVERYSAKASAGMAPDEFFEWQAVCDSEAAMLAQAQQIEGGCRDEMQERRTLDRLADRIRLQQRVLQHRVEQMQMDEAARRTSAMNGSHNLL
jgi:flagellar biosynthesis chaperone FliJ